MRDVKNFMFHFGKDGKINKSGLIYFFVSIIGGISGALIFILLVINFLNAEGFFNEQIGPGINITSKFPRKIVVEQDIAYEEILNKVKYGIVDIYGLDPSKNNNALGVKNLIYPEQFLGKGVVLTTDGWIVAFNIKPELKMDDYLIIFNNEKETEKYKPTEILTDKYSNLIYFKIPAKGLSVLPTASSDSSNGQNVVLIGLEDNLRVENISKTKYSGCMEKENCIKSSDVLACRFLISDDSRENLSSPVINLNGEVMGIMDTSHTAIASDNISKSFKSILKSHTISRPSLGIEYLDLTAIISDINKKAKGALVYKVLPGSAAFESGLKQGDIILKIEKEAVKENNLPELVQEYDKGTLVNLTIYRNDEEMILPVTLK